MNKNLIKSLVAVALGATLSFGIIGCKKAEEGPNGGEGAGPKKSAEPNKMGQEPTPAKSGDGKMGGEASPAPSGDGKMGGEAGPSPSGDGKMGGEASPAPSGDGKMGEGSPAPSGDGK